MTMHLTSTAGQTPRVKSLLITCGVRKKTRLADQSSSRRFEGIEEPYDYKDDQENNAN